MIPPNQPRRGLSRWHFDIDKHLNPFLAPSALPMMPAPIAHFFGYRTHAPAHPLGNLIMIFWAVIGVFASLAVVGAVVLAVPSFQAQGVPTIIGSFGAAAVLKFYAIESPLAQPRNAVLGQLISALVGIAICKLLSLSPHFEAVRWLGASLACACATALMALTGTVHPPAGATALMAVLDDRVAGMGWFLLCPLVLGCCLMVVVAMLVNNVQRRFPYYWWSPGEMGGYWRGKRRDGGDGGDGGEKGEKDGGDGGGGVLGLGQGKPRDEESSGSSSGGEAEVGGSWCRPCRS